MRLSALAGLTVATNAVAAAVSISQRMPAEFGRGVLGRLAVVGDRDRVARDFLTWKGTAMAAPLPLLVALSGLAAAAARGSERARVALAALGAAGVVGHLGEPFTWRVLAARATPGKTALVALSLGLYAGLAALGTVESRRRSS